MEKVNCFFIGLPKSGSTWLYKNLIEQKNIYIPKCKEVNYFNHNYHHSVDWYHSFFKDQCNEKIVMEICHDYIFDGNAAKRIYDYNGKAKIIVFLREPLDWIVSGYLYSKRNGMYNGSVVEFYNDKVEKWKIEYHKLIIPYQKLFGKENVKIYYFDDISSKPEKLIEDIYSYLDLNKNEIIIKGIHEKVNSAASPRIPLINKWITKSSKKIKKLGGYKLIAAIKFTPIVQKILYKPLPINERLSAIEELKESHASSEVSKMLLEGEKITEVGIYDKWY